MGKKQACDAHNPLLPEDPNMSLRILQIDDQLFQNVLAHSVREATRSHSHAGMQISTDQGLFMAAECDVALASTIYNPG